MKALLSLPLLAVLVLVAGISPALGAQLDVTIDPESESSPFKMTYQRTVQLYYEENGNIAERLQGLDSILEGQTEVGDPSMLQLAESINSKIRADGSAASVEDLTVDYKFQLTGRDNRVDVDLTVILQGHVAEYVIIEDQLRKLVELGWRAVGTSDPVPVGDTDINILLNLMEVHHPDIYHLVQGTAAEDIFSMPLINADFILEQPMTNWHFLFDPTGISSDAGLFGMSDELAGKVLSSWTMGESSIREGIQEVLDWDAAVTGHTHPTIPGDISFEVRARQAPDQGNLNIIGFGALDQLDGIEIAGVTPSAPDSANTATGDFPVFIIYGMAGLAAVGGLLFFFVSNRALKNEKQGQQGIDPHDLVGYQTSTASGGYQTNRGEAQLKSNDDYQQTRSYYEQTESTAETTAPVPDTTDEITCSCAASELMSSECDCQMQYSCLCDTTCRCSSEVCRDHVSSMS